LPLGGVCLFLFLKKEQFLQRFFLISLGICSIVLPITVYFVVNNTSFAALEGIFLYNFFYSGQGYTISSLSQSLFYLLQVFFASLLLWFLAVIGLFKRKFTDIDLLFGLFFLFAFLGAAMGGKFAFSKNYLLLVLPSLGYFAAHAIEQLIAYFSKDKFLRNIGILGAAFLLLPTILLQGQAVLAGLYFQGMFNPGQRETIYSLGLPNYNFVTEEKTYFAIASYLNNHTEKDQYILDFGAEPELYLLTNTRTPTRYFYNFPINGVFIHDNRQEERKEMFMSEIQKNKPIYIITNNKEERHKPSLTDLDFPAFKTFLQMHYIHEKTIDNYLIFRLQ